jgi:hypothetical protein
MHLCAKSNYYKGTQGEVISHYMNIKNNVPKIVYKKADRIQHEFDLIWMKRCHILPSFD